MPEYQDYLAILDSDPCNDQALSALEKLGSLLNSQEVASALETTQQALRDRGELEVVARLIDAQLENAGDDATRADLLLKKGHLYVEDFLDEEPGVECFNKVLEIRPDDADAQEALEELDEVRDKWERIVEKYLEEAQASTDRSLATFMYQRAAETIARYQPGAEKIETYLRKALEVDAQNRKAAQHLERLLRKQERWEDLAALLEDRVDAASSKEDRIHALLGLAEVAQHHLDREETAALAMKKVIAAEPGHPRALSLLANFYERDENWSALVMLYTGALKARRRGTSKETELGMLLQIAMLHWKRLDNIDAAEEYFRRIRKTDPAHPAALDFYRAYYPERGETNKLLQVLRQALKGLPESEEERRRALSVEIAELAETEMGNPEKAIDSWKAILRRDPGSNEAREALKRLYAKTEKWNALLDLMKEEIDRIPEDDVEGRIAGLREVVAIYRDRLKLDVMVINTYNSILGIDPENREALDALIDKYKQLGRWNDLIAVLGRKSQLSGIEPAERAEILREIAELWIDRFGNYAQAIKPLEELLELRPEDERAFERLKDIYTRRRQWRALIALMGREAERLPIEGRREQLAEMARLAADRLGDARLAIEIWNRVLELPRPEDPSSASDPLVALATLYEREKRWLALADIYRRQREEAADAQAAVGILERLGTLFADKLRARAQAAEVYREILAMSPGHARAVRTLRELYAASGDYDALEAMYAELGEWDDLVEAFYAIADRLEDRAVKLQLLERSARVAAEHFQSPEKIGRCYERILSVDPKHEEAARALVPIYEKTERWSRLLSTYEILLEHADEDTERLTLMHKIRRLCEERLGSKAVAFQWTARAYELDPEDPELLGDLERLGAEADAWEEVAGVLERRASGEATGSAERLRLLRELAKISNTRLHQPSKAREFWRQLLELEPDDGEAMAALEDLASQQSEWPELLDIYRRRVQIAEGDRDRIDLLFKIAILEEERVGDFDAAVKTYRRILDIDPSSRRSLRALAKIEEARGDWAGLAEVLERELDLERDDDAKVTIHLRLGELYEQNLDRPQDALDGYKQALALGGSNKVYAALERFLGDEVEPETREDVARLLLPEYEDADDARNIARVLEILRRSADEVEAVDYDRRLLGLYARRLDERAAAYDAGLRVLAQRPEEDSSRAELLRLADELGLNEDLAGHMERALASARERAVNPGTRRAIAAELASLYDTSLGRPDRAEKAWLEVLEVEPTDRAAYEALERLYRAAGRWNELRDLLEQRVDNTFEAEERKRLLLAVCDVNETVLDDPDTAIEAYGRVLDVDADNPAVYQALERLYERQERWNELEELLGREIDVVPPGEQGIQLKFRRAELRAHRLEDPSGALDLCEEVIAEHRGHVQARELLEELLRDPHLRLRAARVLEPLYQEDGLWRDLCSVLRIQSQEAETPAEKGEYLARVAEVEEGQLAHKTASFDTWAEALREDPASERAREALLRLAGSLERWQDAADALEASSEVADASDVALQSELWREAARIYDHHLADAERASKAYRRLIDVDPGNPESARPAAEALDRLFSAAEAWEELVDILRKQAEWAEGAEERAEHLARVAEVSEQRLGDVETAVATWREVLEEEPEEHRALDALERLYTEQERYRDLADVLRRRAEAAEGPEAKKEQLARLAEIHERRLEEPSESIVALLEVLDLIPDDRETLAELSRLYRQEERHPDLLDVLERRLSLAEAPTEIGSLTFDVGELLRHHLDRPSEALDRYAQVLEEIPEHEGALVAVEELLEDEDLRVRAAEILQPIYERTGAHRKLASLLEQVAAAVDDPHHVVGNLRRVAEIREVHLGDEEAAFAAYREAVRAALAEPELPDLLGHIERLAAEQGREDELIDIYQDIAPDVLDGDLQRRLYLDIADLSRAVRSDVELARDYYQRVLDAQPDDPRALAALENIYRLGEEHEKLHEILSRKAELSDDDPDARTQALAECARLCAEHLDRPEDAVIGWEQVLEIAPENREAAEALEKLYERAERWHDLAEALERRLGFAFTVEEAVALRVRLGEIYEREIRDPEAAVENYAAALGGDPGHPGATAALERFLDDPGSRLQAAEVLEPVYVSHQDWPKLVRIYEIKLEAADDPDERLKLTRYIARLSEDQLEDLDQAFVWYGRVFKESPENAAVRAQLVRLAGVLENWRSLADIYQEFLDDEAGDTPEVREVALAVADIYDRRLGEVDRALAAYRRVLVANPEDLETFQRLEAMLTRAGRWRDLVEAYEESAQAILDEKRRIELYERRARALEEHLDDKPSAIESYRAVLDIEPEHPGALRELDRLYQEERMWYELGELLRGRVEASSGDPEAEGGYRLRLAELMERHLDDPAGAIEHYETVIGLGGSSADRALSALERLVVHEQHKERIAEILEPVYRENDWWRKLVVILDAKLEFVDDAQERVSVLREIAELHESRGGDQGLALVALSRAWREDPTDDEVYGELAALAAKLGAWDQLVSTLEAGIEDQYDFDLVGAALARIAEIHEGHRDDPDEAIAAWRRLLEVKEDDPDALAALDRLLDAGGKWKELAQVLERRAELAEDPGVRVVLLKRLAELQELKLEQTSEAIAAYKNVLTVDETDGQALDALERLYRKEEDWNELTLTLGRKIELAEDAAARRDLRFAAAAVHRDRLEDAYEAIAQLRSVLDEDPEDREALSCLDELYQSESMWSDLLEVIDRRAALEADAEVRADLAFRAAELVEKELLEPEQAIERLADVLEIAPGHARARQALDALTRNEETLEPAAEVLERLYRDEAAWNDLAELYERRLGLPGQDPERRQELYQVLAEIHEAYRGDDDGAFQVWARALAETPEEEPIQGQLERLASARGSWEELAQLYEKQLDAIVDAELEYHYASKLAAIYEEALGDLDRAAEKYRRALESADDESEALEALARIYERGGNFADLAEVLGRQADASLDEEQQAELLFRLGDVREARLGDARAAMIAYRDVLERDPQHRAARAALERLLGNESLRAEIIAILEPLYESEDDVARLTDLLATKLSVTEDALDRATIYARIAELAEDRLSDPTRALDAVGGWLAEDPGSEQALGEVERLAELVGRWEEVAARLSGIIETTDEEEVKRTLYAKLGAVQLDRLGDLVAAESSYRAVLELNEESQTALEALERIYRQRGDIESLARILWRRGELAFDAQVKRACFAEAGGLREQLGELDAAAFVWKAVLDLEEGDREAHARLAALYERQERWEDLIEILGVAARFAADADEERSLRTRIARLYNETLGDLESAVEAWQAVIDAAPDAVDALHALEAVHERREDWLAVQEALNRRLDFAESDGDRVAIYQRMAAVAQDKRDSPDEAIGYLFQILDIDKSHFETYGLLERALTASERWHDLVELFERMADVRGTLGQTREEIDALARAADVWEGPLENPDAAGEILEKILKREPRYVPALTRLAKIYEGAGEWERCGEILQKALALGPTGRDAADLYVRLGEVARQKSEDLDEALRHFGQALQYDPSHPQAIAALEGAAREREDWATVADMVGRRQQATEDAAEKLELTLELAELYGRRLGQPQAVIPLLESAAQVAPEDPRVLGPLADLYFQAGRHQEAAPMYEKLAEGAKKARRMKDVARYRQRQASILEAAGRGDEALRAYEEAFRVDPTNVETMAGLGRLYMEGRDWDKARRVYRSMVLQNIDPSLGISKAAVYYNLGRIHVELGESQKAKGMFQRGLEVEPDNPQLKQALESL